MTSVPAVPHRPPAGWLRPPEDGSPLFTLEREPTTPGAEVVARLFALLHNAGAAEPDAVKAIALSILGQHGDTNGPFVLGQAFGMLAGADEVVLPMAGYVHALVSARADEGEAATPTGDVPATAEGIAALLRTAARGVYPDPAAELFSELTDRHGDEEARRLWSAALALADVAVPPDCCSECDHPHDGLVCVDNFPDEIQPGFPGGEWMCRWCLTSTYGDDPARDPGRPTS